jgi:transcriptional regulator with XRE-family HTH domain
MSAIAEQLTRIRRARGIPRQQMARKARISRASMDRYEKVKFPGAAALERWARALGYEIALKPLDLI